MFVHENKKGKLVSGKSRKSPTDSFIIFYLQINILHWSALMVSLIPMAMSGVMTATGVIDVKRLLNANGH